MMPKMMRRLSSSSDTDCSQSPRHMYNDILAKFSTPTSPTINSPPKKLFYIQRNSLVLSPNNKIASFGLNSPDQLSEINEKSLDILLNPNCFGVCKNIITFSVVFVNSFLLGESISISDCCLVFFPFIFFFNKRAN